jgi:hypothetical protein
MLCTGIEGSGITLEMGSKKYYVLPECNIGVFLM